MAVLRDFPVPVPFAERAAAWLAGDITGSPAVPRASATVLLLRDGAPHDDAGAATDNGVPGEAAGVEVFLLRRAGSMDFAAGMHAFPGGGVDPRDADDDVPWAGPSSSWWAQALGADEPTARSLVCAAVRETFEECGVLLAGPDEHSVVSDVSSQEWEDERQALLARGTALSELLERRRLVLRSDLLRPWGHWVTPVFEARRYDTRFFLAALPEGQRARDVGGESDQAAWWPARDAVAAYEAGSVVMLPPTIVSVQEIAQISDSATGLALERRVRSVMPRPYATGDGTVVMRVDLDGHGGGDPT